MTTSYRLTPEKAELVMNELRSSLKQRDDQLDALGKITEKIGTGLYLDEALESIYSSFRHLLEFKRIGLALIEPDQKHVKLRWCLSNTHNQRLFEGHTTLLEQSSLNNIIKSSEPLIISDLEDYLKKNPKSETTRLMIEEGMKSHFSYPLQIENRIIGFLFFSSNKIDAFKEKHITLFKHVARELSIIVQKTLLAELNERRHEFLGKVVHDLKSPIAIIKGYTDLLVEELPGKLNEQQLSMLITIQNNTKKMLNLVNDLLDVSAIESGNLDIVLKDTDLGELLKNIQQTNIILAHNKSIILNLNLDSKLPKIRIDPSRMTQVMDNLISNAIKFSHANTTITISAKTSSNEIHITVEDQGQGIPYSEIPHLFEKFAKISVRPTGGEKSTGLGLSIVEQIVQAHDGHVEVESEVGQGTTFTIILPAKCIVP